MEQIEKVLSEMSGSIRNMEKLVNTKRVYEGAIAFLPSDEIYKPTKDLYTKRLNLIMKRMEELLGGN